MRSRITKRRRRRRGPRTAVALGQQQMPKAIISVRHKAAVRRTAAVPQVVLNPDCPHRLCFIDLWFHERTSSTWFMPELFAKRYRVECYYDNYDLLKSPQGEQLRSFHKVVVFQLDPAHLDHHDITWIPMWDEFSVFPKTPTGLRKVVSFSAALHRAVQARGMQSKQFQYWPELPTVLPAKPSDPVILFWSRKPSEVSWHHVRALTSSLSNAKYHIKNVPDPGHGYALVSPEDAPGRITLHGWTPSRDGYSGLLRSSNIFVAPRHREGIGMSFLEAMTHGLCVIAKNDATANEYITNGRNGILYNGIQALNLSRFRELGKAAFDTAQEGRRRWIASQDELLSYI